jgi:hypothetical protein
VNLYTVTCIDACIFRERNKTPYNSVSVYIYGVEQRFDNREAEKRLRDRRETPGILARASKSRKMNMIPYAHAYVYIWDVTISACTYIGTCT